MKKEYSRVVTVWLYNTTRCLGAGRNPDLCVLDGKDGVGSAAGIVVVGCRGDAVGNAFLQKVHGLLAVWHHMLRQVWLDRERERMRQNPGIMSRYTKNSTKQPLRFYIFKMFINGFLLIALQKKHNTHKCCYFLPRCTSCTWQIKKF